MHYIGILKMIDGIAIGMTGAIIISLDFFFSKFQFPFFRERKIRQQHLVGIIIFFNTCPEMFQRILMRYHMFSNAFESDIATGMIAVMVCIEQVADGALALFLQRFYQVGCRIRELGINYDYPFLPQHKTNRTSAFRKNAHIIA